MSGFASTKDLADKQISFDELAPGLYGYTAEGDPNSGVVIGDDSVLVVGCAGHARDGAGCDRAHPHGHRQADQARRAHATITPCACSAPPPIEGAEIIASDVTREMIVERGQQDMDSEIGRFPRLFRGKE